MYTYTYPFRHAPFLSMISPVIDEKGVYNAVEYDSYRWQHHKYNLDQLAAGQFHSLVSS